MEYHNFLLYKACYPRAILNYIYYNMFLYLMNILFSKTYNLYHIYVDSNRIFITEQYNIIIYEGINYNYIHLVQLSTLQYIFILICVFKIN